MAPVSTLWSVSNTTAGTPDPITGAYGLEHPWFAHRSDGTRLVAVNDESAQAVDVHFIDELLDPKVSFPALQDDTRWPSLVVRNNDHVYLAWSDFDETTGNTTFEFSGCAETEDCLQAADWTSEHDDVPTGTQHTVHEEAEGGGYPQLAIDGNRQFLLMMLDPPGNGQNFGVYITSRCGTGEWSTPELVKDRLNINNDQHIRNGKPNIALNKADQVVYVAFTENDDLNNPTEGTVFWARRTYSGCGGS